MVENPFSSFLFLYIKEQYKNKYKNGTSTIER